MGLVKLGLAALGVHHPIGDKHQDFDGIGTFAVITANQLSYPSAAVACYLAHLLSGFTHANEP